MPKHYFELDVDSEWMTRCTLRHNALCGQQNVRCGWHNAWCGQCKACEVWWVGQNQSLTPPHGKNKFLLNEYLGILMHFESTFLFFQIWKMDFFRPTHPLNLENSRFFFFEPFPNGMIESIIGLTFNWTQIRDIYSNG